MCIRDSDSHLSIHFRNLHGPTRHLGVGSLDRWLSWRCASSQWSDGLKDGGWIHQRYDPMRVP
eukprot:413050-Alexandrium_andersonii.AAC.1